MLLAGPVARAETIYSVQKIGIPEGASYSRGVALNDHGQMAVTTGSAGYRWAPGTGFTPLGSATTESRGVYVQDINNSGHIVGYETAGDWSEHAFDWNGSFTDLGNLDPSPNGQNPLAQAKGINDNGWVVGNSKVFVNFTPFRHVLSMESLARPGSHGYAIDVNSSNVIAGTVSDWSYVAHAYKWWPDGTYTELGTGGVAAINDLGQVAGSTTTGRACVWDADGTLRTYGILPYSQQSSSAARDINEQGQVVGYSRNSGTGIHDRRYATLWDPDGTIHDLNTMTANLDGWKLVEATGINEAGQICGYGSADQYAGSDQQAFLLTPIQMVMSSEVVSTPDGPALRLSWPAGDTTAILQASDSLEPGSWSEVTTGIVVEGSEFVHSVPLGPEHPPRQFFRLYRP
ncbi:DUF3466 family protein [Haloferula sp. A504]|uniref:DUF3466 family protein n=1 Tax=Haloferula sp. A504 TaxID=3373601 RepID=UPI0031BDDF17|nr:DUF3466 family protein [Verrucomicrobiaceae bacterium E54]